MLCGDLDETGHSSDERQRFNGMAGLIAPSSEWQRFDKKWKATLRAFRVPYFHMKDFAHFRGYFADWDEEKRRRLLKKLLTHIESIRPIPIGVIFDMRAFRNLPSEKLAHLTEPYMLSCAAMLSLTSGMLDSVGVKNRATIIFSDQVEFRQCALDYYKYAVGRDSLVGRTINSPGFGDMRQVAALQAADIIAYELYKECDRRVNKKRTPPRHGFTVIRRITDRLGSSQPGYAFIGERELHQFITASESQLRRQKYWQDRPSSNTSP